MLHHTATQCNDMSKRSRIHSVASRKLDGALAEHGARTALGRRLGVSPQAISDWATSFRRPPLKRRHQIQELLAIPVFDWLVPARRRS